MIPIRKGSISKCQKFTQIQRHGTYSNDESFHEKRSIMSIILGEGMYGAKMANGTLLLRSRSALSTA